MIKKNFIYIFRKKEKTGNSRKKQKKIDFVVSKNSTHFWKCYEKSQQETKIVPEHFYF